MPFVEMQFAIGRILDQSHRFRVLGRERAREQGVTLPETE